MVPLSEFATGFRRALALGLWLGTTVAWAQSDVSERSSHLPIRREFSDSASSVLVENPFRQVASPISPTEAVRTLPLPAVSSTLNQEQIARQIEIVTKSVDFDEAIRTSLLQQLKQASESLLSANDSASKIAQFVSDIRQSPTLIAEAKTILAQPPNEPMIVAPAEAQLPQLEQQLTQAEARLNEAKAELLKRDTELKRRPERQTELTRQIAEASQALSELRKLPALPASPEEKPVVKTVRQIEQAARQSALELQLEKYQRESQRLDAVTELAPLQRDLAKRQVAFAEKEVAAWRRIVADVRKSESLRQAEDARIQLQSAHPALRELAQRNAALADRRKTIAASIEKVSGELHVVNEQLTQIKSDYEKLQEKVQVAGLSKTIGLLLRKQRADLQTLAAPRERIRFIESEVPSTQLTLIELEDERSILGDVEDSVRQVVGSLETVGESDREMLEKTAATLLGTTRELLDKSIYEYNAYLKELGELELSCRKLIAERTAYAEFIDKHVLWIRSAEPFSPYDVRRAGRSLLTFADSALWLSVGENIVEGLVRKPVQGAVALLLVLVLVILRRRMWNRLHGLCSTESGNSTLRILPTFEALLLVFVASSVWPCLLWCAGWWLESSQDATRFSNAIAHSLQRGAGFLWLFHLARVFARSGGIGETHFGWYASGTKVARDNLLWLGTCGIPVAIIVTMLDTWDDGQSNESLGRLAFITGMIVTGIAMHNVFRRQKGMLQEALARNPTGWFSRVRIVGYVVGTGIPCVFSVLAAAGYYYSARQLAIRFELTILTVLCLLVAHGVLSRWFLVQRRNLAIRQSRERRQADLGERNSVRSDKPDSGTERAEPRVTAASAPGPAMPAQDLTQIHSQLQLLMRHGATFVVLVVTWYVWADVLPALRILDRVVLWNSRTTVVEEIPDPTGAPRTLHLEKEVPTTLTHGLIAILLVAGTIILGKNLPAVLEFAILQRLPIDHGGRNAAAIIFRYLVFLTGLFFVCRTLSVRWSSIQWLAAAMTVGLGFGLQEIFANLVSGLIILFERPVRVGDLVTVNGVTGMVTRMQIRATTITDADRREMIVPNKKFITEDVINWTLSDPISRVTIDLGIAYGSNTTVAHEILMRVAQEHPLVMKEPAPLAMFRGFGESTLMFSLHVFLATRSVYPTVVHDLHTAIDREFRAAGIEMAFPQRDVNIRSISAEILPRIDAMSRAKAA